MIPAGAILQRFSQDGWVTIALGWRPEITEGRLTTEAAAKIDALMAERLGIAIEALDCVHPAGPPTCWCRRPLPGLGVLCIHRHHLDPGRCVYVGAGPQDPGFARRCGFQYVDAEEFLTSGASRGNRAEPFSQATRNRKRSSFQSDDGGTRSSAKSGASATDVST
jgi:histidinol phosphatase-like enzyme